MTLKQIGEKYKLSWNGYQFWATYWINWPGVTASPLKGKASPEELQNAVNEAFSADPFPPETPSEAQFQMLRNALGVDCSGFVYHTLASFLEQSDIKLADYLYIPKTDVVEARKKDSWKKVRQLTEPEIAALPIHIPVSYIADQFKRKPEHLVNVARLCNQESCLEINDTTELKLGDMVYITGKFGDHIQLITGLKDDTAEVMSSRYEPLGPGGVTVENFDASVLRKSGTVWRLKCTVEGEG